MISGLLYAQSGMTDDQVVNYVKNEYKNGTDPQVIAKNLLAKGATMEQLQRLRNQSQGVLSSNNAARNSKEPMMQDATTNMGRLRVDNSLLFEIPLPEDSLSLFTQEEEEPKVKIFGHDIFNNKQIHFESNVNVATPDSYVLGAGDQVFIDIYGASQETYDLMVSPEGRLLIPDFGPVSVNGLTVQQAAKRVRQELGRRYADSEISLSLGQTRTILVNVMGEVTAPGSYSLSGFSTIFYALYAAGGVSDIGSLRAISLYRSGRLVTTVDIYQYLFEGKLSKDIKLAEGDVIVVPSYDQLVKMEGQVKRPMYYEMVKGESLQKALDYAGGLRGDAYNQVIRVMRSNGRDMQAFNVDVASRGSFLMADGDSVIVESVLRERMSNTVEIKGAVFRPGFYQYGGKVSTVKELIMMADGVTEEAFTSRAIMHRRKTDRTLEVLSVDVEGILAGYSPDVPLRDEDVLYIPSNKERNEERTVSVFGEVYYPGDYPYAEKTCLEDLILLAGGLKDNASSVKVDVARRIVDPTATKDTVARSEVFTFSLKEGFVIDGEPSFTLQPFDQVYVHQSPVYNTQTRVEVVGEVLFAGSYTLAEQDERLSSIVLAAGGLNSRAYAKGARLQRLITPDEKRRRDQLLHMVKGSEKDSVDMSKLELENTYYVGIDLEKAMSHPGCTEDIVLREGDKLIIPQINSTVTINGEVLYPNTVSFEKGQRASYYINQAGGYTTDARRRQAYVIYQNGQVAKVRKGAKIQPGCEIVVPTKQQRTNTMQTTTQWVAISSSIGTLAAVLISALR